MNVCFPVFQNQGLASMVSSHFDSAPLCVIVNTGTRSMLEIANRAPLERHGLCRELIKHGGTADTAFVVDGIGAGALAELRHAGFRVFQAQPGTVADNLERMSRNELMELADERIVSGATQSNDDDDDDLPGFGCGF
jgi:ArsR family transcriptional regulator